ncbi:MAG: hypothetical protein KDB22_00965 [Planctomycetales bacterium]|nr:hypothetical protein [Planctomycetales bacterium]
MRHLWILLLFCCLPPLLAQDRSTLDVAPKAAAAQDGKVPQVTADQPMTFWMKHKLEYSKSMLESLTMGDYKQMAATAEQMRLLTKIEGFVRRKNVAYRVQLHSFELSLQEMLRHAKQENPEGATLAFNQMTTSCVACHTLLREGVE